MEEIPDGVPSEDEFNPEANPHAVPPNHAGAMSIEVGVDAQHGLVIIGINDPNGLHVRTGLPVAAALQVAYSLLGKCNQLLMGPPPDLGDEPGGGPSLVLPGEF